MGSEALYLLGGWDDRAGQPSGEVGRHGLGKEVSESVEKPGEWFSLVEPTR